MLFRVSALKTVGLFDENIFMYCEDIDITRRMHNKFITLYFPGATITHDHARESYKNYRMLFIHMKNAARYFNKWGWVNDPIRVSTNKQTIDEISKTLNPAP